MANSDRKSSTDCGGVDSIDREVELALIAYDQIGGLARSPRAESGAALGALSREIDIRIGLRFAAGLKSRPSIRVLTPGVLVTRGAQLTVRTYGDAAVDRGGQESRGPTGCGAESPPPQFESSTPTGAGSFTMGNRGERI